MRAFPALALILLAAATACDAADRDFAKTVPADARGAVEISNVSGSVSIIGWERPEVEVKAKLSAGVERVDVGSDRGRTVIKVVLPSMSSRHGEAELEVHVPRQSELEVTAVSADLDTSQMLGAQRLKSVSGDIRAELAAADFEAKTVSGDIKVRGNAQAADVRVSTVSGDLVVERSAGAIDATTVSGDLRVALDPARGARLHTTSGDITFSGALTRDASLEAETISGDIVLKARGEAGYDYEASSFSGDLGNCFGKEAESTSRHGPGTRLNGSVGAGSARVRVRSMSGDVDLCDH